MITYFLSANLPGLEKQLRQFPEITETAVDPDDPFYLLIRGEADTHARIDELFRQVGDLSGHRIRRCMTVTFRPAQQPVVMYFFVLHFHRTDFRAHLRVYPEVTDVMLNPHDLDNLIVRVEAAAQIDLVDLANRLSMITEVGSLSQCPAVQNRTNK